MSYYLIYIWVIFAGIVYKDARFNILTYVNDEQYKVRPTAFYVVLFCVPLLLNTAFRVGFGDTEAYRNGFLLMPKSIPEILTYIELKEFIKDPVFVFFQGVCNIIFDGNDILFFGLVAIIQLICFVGIYKKYSEDFWLSMMVFVFTTDYIQWMHNGIRQFLAVAIVYAALPLLEKKKYFQYCICVLIAATIHQTALLMLIAIFLTFRRVWDKRILLIILGVCVLIFAMDKWTGVLDEMLLETQYKDVHINWENGYQDGANPLRMLVYSVPCILSFITRKQIRSEDNFMLSLSCNMSVMGMLLYILSVFTSGIFFGRIPIYFTLASNGILLPWMVNRCFTDTSKKLLYFIMIICYSVFYFYSCHVGFQVI